MESEIYWLKDDAKMQKYHTEQLEEQVVDYSRVKKYMGEDRVQQIVDNVKLVEEREREHRKWNHSMEWSR